MHQTFQITAQKEWKKECPTFLHKIVDGWLNLASCFDAEGKGTQFLWDACREEAWDQSPCSLPSALYHRATASAIPYSDEVTTWVRWPWIPAGPRT